MSGADLVLLDEELLATYQRAAVLQMHVCGWLVDGRPCANLHRYGTPFCVAHAAVEQGSTGA